MTASRTSTALGLGGLLLAACGGGGALTLEEYAARAPQAICEYGVRCGSLPNAAACHYVADLRQPQADIQSGKTLYDGVAAATCLDAIAARSCSLSEIFTAPAACEEAAKGTAPDGAACSVGNQCASRSCLVPPGTCDQATACCPGTCAATRQPVGGDCSASRGCVAGAFCDLSGANPTCKVRGALGGACSTLAPCAEILNCVKPAGAAEGTCVGYPKHGEPCTAGPLPCDDQRDTCDPVTSTCVARLAVGADCSAAPSGCVRFSTCAAASHTCVARGDLGADCSAGAGCLTPRVCTNGVCAEAPLHPVCP